MSQSTSGGYQQQNQSGNRPLSRRFRKISRVSQENKPITIHQSLSQYSNLNVKQNNLTTNFC